MRKMRTVVYSMALVALLCAAANFAYGQELSAADKERGMQYLETTKKNIVEATKGLSEAQWNFKAAPDRWSVAETMEHIAAAEDLTARDDRRARHESSRRTGARPEEDR